MILVQRPVTDSGDKPFPDARLPVGVKRVAALIPAVEITHNENLHGIRRPDSELSAAYPVVVHDMSAQFVVESKVAALVKEVEVVIS